jgi:hypothetical protein
MVHSVRLRLDLTMMVRTFWIGLVCLLTSGSAEAFQQSGSGQSLAPAVATGSDSKSVELSDQVGRSGSGTTFAIPGLGSLGVLPKLDFGLELLYGEGPGGTTDPNIEIPADDDGLRIKGTLKHRF